MAQLNNPPKNYFSSSALVTFKDSDFREKTILPKELCFASEKQNHLKLTLQQFMENQEKKHLSTKFNKKEVASFLKEKDAAMEEINIDENIPKKSEYEIKYVNKEEPDLINNENALNNVNNIVINQTQNDNKSSHILIFKGTFGKDEINRIMNQEHENHHHHHHHHHHHIHSNNFS